MESIFVKDEINKKRQPELDIAKFIAIVFMIICHVGVYYFDRESTGIIITSMFGGEFAAPVFMVCLGICTCFTSHNTPKDLIKRGVKTLILGYVLNIVRGLVPSILPFVSSVRELFPIMDTIMNVDIMQFAGMAFIVLGLFKKLKINVVIQFIISILFLFLGEILVYVKTDIHFLDLILGLIWGTTDSSFFPLLNWFIFPAAGVLFGELLVHCKNKDKLYKSLLMPGLLGVILAYTFQFFFYDNYYVYDSYYFMNIKSGLFALFFPMFLFSICYFISKKTKIADLWIVRFAVVNINKFYCISWVLILWAKSISELILGVPFNTVFILISMVIIFILTYLITYIDVKWKEKKALKH